MTIKRCKLSKKAIDGRTLNGLNWFKSRYKDFEKNPTDFDSVSWNIKHSEFLDKVFNQYHNLYECVNKERQNEFKLRGSNGSVLRVSRRIV